MKKTILLIFFASFIFNGVFSQVKSDTIIKNTKNETFVTVTKSIDGNREVTIQTDNDGFKDIQKIIKKKKSKNNYGRHLSKIQKAFALMPVLIYLLFFMLMFFVLHRNNFKFSDLFTAKCPKTIVKTTTTKTDPSDSTKTITEVREEPVDKTSLSRFLALITVLVLLTLIVCAFCYYIYFSLSGYKPIQNISSLWLVFGTLVIGIIPYSIKTMFKK